MAESGLTCALHFQLAFIFPSLSIFLGGLFTILAFRSIRCIYRFILKQIWRKKVKSKEVWWSNKRKQRSVYYIRIFSTRMQMMLSAQTYSGRVLMILVFLLNIGTLIIYFIDLTEAEQFHFSFPDRVIYVDKFFNAFFVFYFGLRFVAADDKLRFWLELNSLVDFFTIPPVFVSSVLRKSCLGLRFLRALRLLDLPRILQILRITKDNYSIKLSKLFAVFISTWLTAAGFIHLVENNGDPWVQPVNSQPITYFKCMYLVMVTMSTVGYGDIVVQTALGRAFIFFFIIGGLVLFANFIPEVLEIAQNHKSYKSSYKVMSGKNYIVVCGNVTLKSVTTFLQDFLLQDKGNICTEILFLGESLPSLELEAVFKCYSPYTSFFHGSALNSEDLKRVRMESANACLILADVCTPEPYAEDISNIMRVLSIKNHYPKTRIIVQIIQSRNKAYLPNIPNWDWKMGDSIICFAELKLGFMAQSCLVPGLSTLLTSLFIRKENTETKRKHLKDETLLGDKDYKVMAFQLSDDFAGMTFIEVCRLCFVKLNLILLGIELQFGSRGESAILINPSPQIKICQNTMGFFIAHSLAEVKRAHFYCRVCHSDIQDPEQIEKCQCGSKLHSKTFSEKLKSYGESLVLDGEPAKSRVLSILPRQIFVDRVLHAHEDESHKVSFYLTGRYHQCDAVPLYEALLSCKNQTVLYLQNHILVCVFGDANSPLIGLQDFVMPLRATNFLYHELKDIVLLGPLDYLQREWEFIQNFPKLWLFSGSALSCVDLKAVNVQDCAACVILSSSTPISNNPSLVDAESILAILNIQSMEVQLNSSSVDAVFRARALGNQSEPRYKRIPITTELKFSPNAHFINQSPSSSSDIPEEDLLSPTAAPAGAIFSDSFLNSLLSMTYYNHHILALLQALVTSRTSPVLEHLGEEDSRLSRSLDNMVQNPYRVRCKLALLPLSERWLSGIMEDSFGDIYCKALDTFGILCFGLYRLMEEPNPYKNRFVIARPTSDLKMLPTDLLFSIVPFNIATTEDL
ncbi:potassium channel subfamily U member 1 isoform X1 [Phasianus colchicus]|uniref:BK channel n=2 Tax=Phasianus colchicus TaxID=9054 RepID=A0A669PV14_PHACC|nr:potassium channel subfamily U member 1 isoform X1 [Phasianus colchicus]